MVTWPSAGPLAPARESHRLRRTPPLVKPLLLRIRRRRLHPSPARWVSANPGPTTSASLRQRNPSTDPDEIMRHIVAAGAQASLLIPLRNEVAHGWEGPLSVRVVARALRVFSGPAGVIQETSTLLSQTAGDWNATYIRYSKKRVTKAVESVTICLNRYLSGNASSGKQRMLHGSAAPSDDPSHTRSDATSTSAHNPTRPSKRDRTQAKAKQNTNKRRCNKGSWTRGDASR